MVVSAIRNAQSATRVSCRVNRFHRSGLCPGTPQFLARRPGSRSDDIFVPLWAALPLTSGQECPRSLQETEMRSPSPNRSHSQAIASGVQEWRGRPPLPLVSARHCRAGSRQRAINGVKSPVQCPRGGRNPRRPCPTAGYGPGSWRWRAAGSGNRPRSSGH